MKRKWNEMESKWKGRKLLLHGLAGNMRRHFTLLIVLKYYGKIPWDSLILGAVTHGGGGGAAPI